MNKVELVDAIIKDVRMSGKTDDVQSKAQVTRIVDSVFANITKTVSKGEDVSLVGFGTFTTVKKAARTGRNPLTGAEVKIAAKTAPKFKPGKAFKESVDKKKK